ncbi:MAG: prepilin-type N-terminal cleavage/methylation domain-containing protein [Candidatus Paceibacterota bacterium]|jgi:MSHA pilin protein MshD
MCISRRQQGMTLIELIVFIVIVSVALAGVLTVLNITAKSSADPMIRKQMLAIAEALLEEVQLQPFTWCDPDDPNAATATGTAGCTAGYVEASGPETIAAVVEARGNATTPFDNVNDYANLSLPSPILSSTGSFSAPTGYSASIAVTPEALNGVGDATPASASLRISVTVTNGGESIVLEGYRTRHSPNLLP